jgi:hypothetical protein
MGGLIMFDIPVMCPRLQYRPPGAPFLCERSDSMNTPLDSLARNVRPERSSDMVLLGAHLIGLEIIVLSFLVLDWGHGIARGCILFGLLSGLILFRIHGQPWRQVAS